MPHLSAKIRHDFGCVPRVVQTRRMAGNLGQAWLCTNTAGVFTNVNSFPKHMVVSCILPPLSLLLPSAAPTTGGSLWRRGTAYVYQAQVRGFESPRLLFSSSHSRCCGFTGGSRKSVSYAAGGGISSKKLRLRLKTRRILLLCALLNVLKQTCLHKSYSNFFILQEMCKFPPISDIAGGAFAPNAPPPPGSASVWVYLFAVGSGRLVGK